MVMELPDQLEVAFVSSTSDVHGYSDILVSVEIWHNGRYYFGTNMNLTDDNGKAAISRESIESSFALNQQTFLMDYKTPLSSCDPQVVLSVLGGRRFLKARRLARESGVVSEEALNGWNRAKNEGFRSAQAAIVCDIPTASKQVTIEARPTLIKGWW